MSNSHQGLSLTPLYAHIEGELASPWSAPTFPLLRPFAGPTPPIFTFALSRSTPCVASYQLLASPKSCTTHGHRWLLTTRAPPKPSRPLELSCWSVARLVPPLPYSLTTKPSTITPDRPLLCCLVASYIRLLQPPSNAVLSFLYLVVWALCRPAKPRPWCLWCGLYYQHQWSLCLSDPCLACFVILVNTSWNLVICCLLPWLYWLMLSLRTPLGS
jgi:hypothetical protein